jgi:hypothetical protein
MKALIKVVGLVVVCGFLFFFGAQLLLTQETKQIRPTRPPKSQGTTAQETYVSKVVISAPWGEKNLYKYAGGEESPPGEFGIYISKAEDGELLAPNTFTVAPNGDIYIADPLNKRIQRFSQDGAFLSIMRIIGDKICVDYNNNIYLLPFQKSVPKEKWPEEKWFVNKYDQTGNLLKTYPIDHPISDIYCDNKGRLFASYGEGIFQIGTKDGEFPFALQKSTLKKGGFLGSNSCVLDKDQFFQSYRGKLLSLVDLNTNDTIKVFQAMEGSFFGTDTSGAIYTNRSNIEQRAGTVTKYNQDGKLVAVIKRNWVKTIANDVMNTSWVLDKNGSFYRYLSTEEGIKIIKWYRQP